MPTFSKATLDKAKAAMEAGQVHEDPAWNDLWHVKDYRVQVGRDASGQVEYLTCTCPNGLHNGPESTTCYHVCAVILTLTWRAQEAAR